MAGDTSFALDLYRELAADETDANVFCSPYSVSVALAMTLAGARGATWAQMAAMLRTSDDETWHEARGALDRHLLRARPTVADREPLTMEIANSLWGQTGYTVRDDYLDLLARHYGTGLQVVDFTTAAEQARATINAWVEAKTNGRIDELVPEGAIDELTRLVLVNAIFFRASWVHQFDPERTTDGSFQAPGGVVTVPMMRQSVRTTYGQGDGWSAIRLPYAGEASMLVIAPDAGRFDEVAHELDSALLDRVRSSIGDHQVDLSMPRIAFRSSFSLPGVLRRLGMVDAFAVPTPSSGADFTGMVEARELFVTDVLHQALVSVDEAGTEAAAATAVMIGRMSLPPPATLTLDRPFILVIEDDLTDSILFIGHVTDPTAG